MSDTVISVEHLSKRYQLGVINTASFKDDFKIWFAKIRGEENPISVIGNTDYSDRKGELVWALQDINFTVRRGEALGIIGRNGAGKSTFLKILSRVTAPTEGRVRVKGRISSLLEVGTGFHPELTGRENIFLNGAIMGMNRAEVKRKLDEIIDFSGVEKYIDTPVKRYSSGMYVRLGFAVAAHLEPEILVVDEVLAVGDAEFQKKCLGKMGEVAGEGRTVLFVSHNMGSIKQLCRTTLWINQGKVADIGETSKIVEDYLLTSTVNVSEENDIDEIIRNLPPDPVFKLLRIRLSQDGKLVTNSVVNNKSLEIEVEYQVFQPTTGLRIYFDLLTDDSFLLFRSFHDNDAASIPKMQPGTYISRASIPNDVLANRKYKINVNAIIHKERSILPLSGIHIPLTVFHAGNYNRGYPTDKIRGALAVVLKWKTTREQ